MSHCKLSSVTSAFKGKTIGFDSEIAEEWNVCICGNTNAQSQPVFAQTQGHLSDRTDTLPEPLFRDVLVPVRAALRGSSSNANYICPEHRQQGREGERRGRRVGKERRRKRKSKKRRSEK